jgi:predicted acylesterase/phospholipase RssA
LSDLSFDRDQQSIYENSLENPDYWDLRVWQAARATSAAPTYFPEFHDKASGLVFWDGGLYNNNPSEIALSESRRIWTDTTYDHPDILLSVGCGWGDKVEKRKKSWREWFASYRHIRVLVHRLEANMNSEDLWHKNFSTLSRQYPRRYVRLNPKFTRPPPKLDSLVDLNNKTLERTAKEYLEKEAVLDRVDEIAFRLVATSFFLKLSTRPTPEGNSDVNIEGGS